MLKVHGVNDTTPENMAANQLAKIACNAIPDLENNTHIILEIFPSVQCFGQNPQDIDLLVFFADYRNSSVYRTNDGKYIHSFCTSIELKRHSPSSITFEGEKCYVEYNGHRHDVTGQSEGQKYSVVNYIKKQNPRNSPPWITNLIWLNEYPKSRLPSGSGNIIGTDSDWHDILDTIGNISNIPKIECFSSRPYLNNILLIFSKRLENSDIDRKKLEIITKSVLDRTQQQYAEKLGEQLLIFRGRGGTGKTVRLIRAAYQVYEELGSRVLILTYNKALVADIHRLLTLLKVKNAIGEGGLAIKTIHSFMYEWLDGLDVYDKKEDGNFIENYENIKQKALEFIQTEIITHSDIEETKAASSIKLTWDLIMIDESQDWPASERDLIYKLYGYEKVIIADGIDQFVRGIEHIDWRNGIDSSKTQIVPLRKSLRLKANLCKTVGYFAEKIDFQAWNLEPLPESYGGRVIVIFGNAMSEKFHRKLFATLKKDNNKPIDMLLCVPPSWVESNGSKKQSRVANQYREWGLKVWDAVDEEQREAYPTSLEQYRIVQYDSCRGLEGWIVVNFALDEFFDYKIRTAEHSDLASADMFFDKQQSALEYAKKWIMIPLTRAVDTLVIHISDRNSYVGQCLIELHDKFPENIELQEFV